MLIWYEIHFMVVIYENVGKFLSGIFFLNNTQMNLFTQHKMILNHDIKSKLNPIFFCSKKFAENLPIWVTLEHNVELRNVKGRGKRRNMKLESIFH